MSTLLSGLLVLIPLKASMEQCSVLLGNHVRMPKSHKSVGQFTGLH